MFFALEEVVSIPPHPGPQFGRIAELDVLHVRPKGEGQGCPESLPLKSGGEGVILNP